MQFVSPTSWFLFKHNEVHQECVCLPLDGYLGIGTCRIALQADALAEDAHALVAKAVGKASGWAITDLYIGASNFQQLQTSTLTQYELWDTSTTTIVEIVSTVFSIVWGRS